MGGVLTSPSDVQVTIMLAAERLFAERGVAHVSLREIAAAAGQRNNSAVQYHFTDKRTLIIALYNYRLAPLNERRSAMLAMRADHTIPQLVEVYIRPLASAVVEAEGSNSYARLINRYLAEGADFDGGSGDLEPFETDHTSAVVTVLDELSTKLTQLPEPARRERIRQMMHLVAGVLADIERRLARRRVTRAEAVAAIEGLIGAASAFLLAG
jgi:AcrR family transcriptional regulator